MSTASLSATLSAPAPPPRQEAPSPKESPSCAADLLCRQMFEWTDSPRFAESSYYILIKPLRILLIIALAVVVRHLLHRAISGLATTTSEIGIPTILKPLRERVPSGAPDPAAVFPERRRQRAMAIGSVLRSFVTAAVYTVAALLILGELNFDLAPLLASAGIAGVALGFGAQSLVKDLIAGLFMLLEDQYGVGDTVDVGEAIGVVETVGLRVTTVRDARGVLWYIRNGEIIRVGNKSQGWAMAVVDIPIGFVSTEQAIAVLREAALSLAEDATYATEFLEPPEVLGVEQLTVDGAVIRTIAKTTADGQFTVSRELRRRLTEALETSGIAERIAASRMFPRPAVPDSRAETGQGGAT